jgi:hypothetical protein
MQLLKREVNYSVVLNKNRMGSIIQFEALEEEEQLLKDNLGFTILKHNEIGWIPII